MCTIKLLFIYKIIYLNILRMFIQAQHSYHNIFKILIILQANDMNFIFKALILLEMYWLVSYSL